MSFQADFYAWLDAQAGVTAIVGDRIYPLRLPQEVVYPAIRFERDGDAESLDFAGQGGLHRTEIQLDALAETHAAAVDLAAAVRTALLNFRGAMGSTFVTHTQIETTFDTWEESLDVYRVSQAWTFSHH